MHNMDDPETTAKISDSAYSNSCSNSQSRRSHSSKSTHSGSHSSGSSGYGGKVSTSGSSNTLGQPPKKDKDSKKKKLLQPEIQVAETAPVVEPVGPKEPDPIFVVPPEEPAVDNVVDTAMSIDLPETLNENMDTSPPQANTVKDEMILTLQPALSFSPTKPTENYVTSRLAPTNSSDGFSCAISMRDGVVTYTTASLTTSLGFPKDIWVGRSFINFVHPKDHKMFSSLITNGLAFPNGTNGMEKKGPTLTPGSTMVCRIRRYRSLNSAFGVKDSVVTYMPFLLKLSFKQFDEDDVKITYLVVHATPFFSAFKIPNEIITKPNPFTIRHDATGILDYIDPESVPYLGYLPQDVQDKDVLQLYHPEDLPYLLQIYENIVKEGSVMRSRPYRMMAQNGDFVKLETEWSSVVNPWSMKLEFVIGVHYIIEGPKNPDVFQSPDAPGKITDAEQFRITALRECIVRVMTELRTKPAEAAKKVIGKRCQELASYMETLVEEPTTANEELSLDTHDLHGRDNVNYERDSVMLGGISPHHDSDSKSSIETPLSYNQLNYNENLQRFFESQPHLNPENYQAIPGDVLGQREYYSPHNQQSHGYNAENCLSPMAQNSGDTNELSSNASSAVPTFENSPGQPAGDYQYTKLTESVLLKHNAEMEKELVKMHRESRSSKEDKEKAFNETRKKKKEHLARCKASFYPTMAGMVFENMQKERHCLKRQSKQEPEATCEKHHCPSSRYRHTHEAATPTNVSPGGAVPNHRPSNPNVNTLMYGVRMPQQMSMIAPGIPMFPGIPGTSGMPGPSVMPAIPGPSVMQPIPGTSVMQPVPCTSGTTIISGPPGMPQVQGMPGMSAMPGMTGMYPVYYAPTTPPAKDMQHPAANAPHQFQAPMPYMMHGHPMYGQQFVYSPMNAQIYPIQHPAMSHIAMQYSDSPNPLGLAASNYEQACKSSLLMSTMKPFSNAAWREKKRAEAKAKANQYSGETLNSILKRTSEVPPSMRAPQLEKYKTRNSEEIAERTDGESSYSSFYSSFFKTDSGSAEESSDHKKKINDIKNKFWTKNNQIDDALSFQSSTEGAGTYLKPKPVKKLAYKKVDAHWNEQVNLTSELVYRYQMVTKPVEEVLEADKKKIAKMEQPSLVNEQLGQLYLDLQLQGVASRLTLEEGITSSSSSGEDTPSRTEKPARKREYNKLIIIHEENAPLPPPESGPPAPEGPPEAPPDNTPCASTSQT